MKENKLILGWELTPTLEPKYWMETTARPGYQSNSDLVTVPASSIAAHTAIIAQSGSGKSFFLGRFIEEIMLRTKCKCIILDPNADFKKINKVVEKDLWENVKYDIINKKGKLPHEKNRSEFQDEWRKVSIRINTQDDSYEREGEKIKIFWPSVNIEFFADEVDPMFRSDLHHCHRFVKAISNLLEYKAKSEKRDYDLLKEASKYLKIFERVDQRNRAMRLEQDFDVEILAKVIRSNSELLIPNMKQLLEFMNKIKIQNSIQEATIASEFISPDISKYYFGKAREFQAVGIVNTLIEKKKKGLKELSEYSKRLEVIDLPSLQDKNSQHIAISSILNNEWERVRNEWDLALRHEHSKDFRVPTFIVIDEAHNIIPHTPRNKAEHSLREQFRTIIAEGRKYGLFLILVSQRPDKLDPLIISECENRALMKLNSQAILEKSKSLLGFDDISQKILEKCLEFPTGRVMLTGPWAEGSSKYLMTAARRTVEGGRNLRPEHWAKPVEDK